MAPYPEVNHEAEQIGWWYSSQLVSEIPILRSGRGIHIFFYETKVLDGLFSCPRARTGRRPTIVEDYMDPSLCSGFQKKTQTVPLPQIAARVCIHWGVSIPERKVADEDVDFLFE